MTKEKIIELIEQKFGEELHWEEAVADELLALIKKELLERLEKLHTEMDERMREEVAIEKRIGEKKAEKLLNQIEELTTGKCALRCPLVLQEKKEVAREIINKFDKQLTEKCLKSAEQQEYQHTARILKNVCPVKSHRVTKELAKEYGVEL